MAAGDRVAGLIAALASAVGFDVFLTRPFLSLAIDSRDDIELAVAVVLVGLAVTEIAVRGRTHREAAVRRREGYLSGLTSLLDPTAGTTDERRRVTAAAVREMLSADRVHWVEAPPSAADALVATDGSVSLGGRPLDVQRVGLPIETATAVPAHDGPGAGHLRVVASTRVVRPAPEQLRVAVLLARLAGAAHDGAEPPTAG
ncbi:MAG: DUF4118 domain-containing protein [Phycicoccus sp.]